MANNQSEYISKISIAYSYNKKTTDILPTSISDIAIVSDYMNSSAPMPIIIIKAKLPIKLYNKMIKNKQKKSSKIIFKLELSSKDNDNKTSTRIIDGDFDYIFPDSAKLETDIETYMAEDEHSDSTNKNIVFSIISDTLININKKLISGIYSNSTRGDIIYSMLEKDHTGKRMLVIEPFKDNNKIKNLLIPMKDSVASAISFIDSQVGLYDSGYIFFIDFDITYLISTKGSTKMNVSGYGHPTFNIDILSMKDVTENNTNGVVENSKKKAYTLPVTANDFSPSQNHYTEKKYNTLKLIDTDGKMKTIELDINQKENSVTKINPIRVPSSNKLRGAELKDSIESTAFMITITKGNINSHILQPFKQFIVENVDEYKAYNGKYILTYKREFFMNAGESFVSAVQFILRKK